MKKLFLKFSRFMQRAVVTILLFFVYILGFGVTALFARIFARSLLSGRRRDEGSYWIEAKGYEADMADSLRQS